MRIDSSESSELAPQDSTRPTGNEKLPLPTPANKNADADVASSVTSPLQRELTGQALLAGCLLGALLAAANVYTALKTGYIDGGSITASVLSFTAFRVLRRPYSALENNLTQTVASSAAVMSFVAGVAGPIPALERAGFLLPSWVLVLWSLALGVLGIAIGAMLRSKLITAEGLPFPTGTATAEVIAAMSEASGRVLNRARGLLLAAVAAAVIAWLRDGPLALIPQALNFGGTLAGISAADLALGVSLSPLMFATGLITGLRAGTSMLVGGVIAWAGIAPWLVNQKLAAADDHGQLISWLLWPGVALVLSGSLTSLALQWRSLARGFGDVRGLLTRTPRVARLEQQAPPRNTAFLALIVLCAALVVVIAQQSLGLAPWTTCLALVVSVALSVVCARGAGETDLAPAGDMGGLTQLIFGSPVNAASSLTCGAIVTANATQTAQTLWAFKAGERLGANPRRQVLAQLLGAVVGGLVVVPTYAVVVRAYGLGSERLPAIAVLSWQATAAAVQGGLASLPRYAATTALIAFALGCVLTLLGQTRAARYLPSPAALGIGFLMPVSMSATLFIGAVTLTVLSARFPTWTREHVESIAGGAIAGESLFAVVLAALIAFGVLSG